MKNLWLSVIFFLAAFPVFAQQSAYRLPPKEVVAILDAKPLPSVSISPARNAMLFVDPESLPPIELLARPILRLGGIRIDPKLGTTQRTQRFTGISIQALPHGVPRRVELPRDAMIGYPQWSPDGTRFAFTRDLVDGVELWVGESASARAFPIPNLRVNDVTGDPFEWLANNRSLLVRGIPFSRGAAPAAAALPTGPNIQETSGKKSQMSTFQDLLENEHDEALFEHFATCQLAVIDIDPEKKELQERLHRLGTPGIFTSVDFSPNEEFLLVTKLKKPFSYRVPFNLFARTTEIWDKKGRIVRTIADLPVSDEIPRQGVPTGPRSITWQMLQGATLLWVEALDGGDPIKKVPFRDKMMRLPAPFFTEPAELTKIQHRFQGFAWTARVDEVFVTEVDRDRRWRTTAFLDLRNPAGSRRVLFDLSTNDAYNNPGTPVLETLPDGQSVMIQEDDWIYLAGTGATETGDRPFLDRFHLKTLEKKRLFRCDESSVERFVSFVQGDRKQILVRYETPKDAPNYFLRSLIGPQRQPVTTFSDWAPQFAGVTKELLKYKRGDGVPLSGTLYLPADYRPGTRLPCLIWAYPLEYSDAATAGQVRATPNAFSRPSGASPLFFLTQGYAVLMDATMPIVGDPETMNDTYIEQTVAAGKAAVETLDAKGVIDPQRVVVSGHSYGAFMTANLLAHCDLFAAGIARSGAYNRSLTPFGFQSERRSFWEAPDLYMKVSPFTHAPKINEPLLLIHGEADNNPGTFPVQSERLFQALQGNRATARLVLLPHESHGYRARESVLHTLAEMMDWADRYAKNRKLEDPR